MHHVVDISTTQVLHSALTRVEAEVWADRASRGIVMADAGLRRAKLRSEAFARPLPCSASTGPGAGPAGR